MGYVRRNWHRNVSIACLYSLPGSCLPGSYQPLQSQRQLIHVQFSVDLPIHFWMGRRIYILQSS